MENKTFKMILESYAEILMAQRKQEIFLEQVPAEESERDSLSELSNNFERVKQAYQGMYPLLSVTDVELFSMLNTLHYAETQCQGESISDSYYQAIRLTMKIREQDVIASTKDQLNNIIGES